MFRDAWRTGCRSDDTIGSLLGGGGPRDHFAHCRLCKSGDDRRNHPGNGSPFFESDRLHLSSAYVGFFRGTPLLVQIFLVYMGLPGLHPGLSIDRWTAGILTLSLNSSAYVAEIIRAGIQSIDRGQSEAAIASGLTPRQRLRYVILPQAFRRIIPPFGQ